MYQAKNVNLHGFKLSPHYENLSLTYAMKSLEVVYNADECKRNHGQAMNREFLKAEKQFNTHKPDGSHLDAINTLVKLAKRNHPPAQSLLGHIFLFNQYMANDHKQAFYWLQLAALNKQASAQYNLALMYENGIYVTKDVLLAIHWYCQAAELNHSDAQIRLGELYLEKNSLFCNEKEAEKWLSLAAAEGSTKAMVKLCQLYLSSNFSKDKVFMACNWLDMASKINDKEAIFNIATMYELGIVLPKDTDLAIELYSKIADCDYLKAQINLGHHFFNLKPSPNYKQSLFWFLRAAKNGDADSQHQVAQMYLQGIGTYPDEQVAREWLHMAADQGHTESQYVLAKMSYFNDATGGGVLQGIAD